MELGRNHGSRDTRISHLQGFNGAYRDRTGDLRLAKPRRVLRARPALLVDYRDEQGLPPDETRGLAGAAGDFRHRRAGCLQDVIVRKVVNGRDALHLPSTSPADLPPDRAGQGTRLPCSSRPKPSCSAWIELRLRNGRPVLDSYAHAVALANPAGEPSDHDSSSAQPHGADGNGFKPASRRMPNDGGLCDGAACLPDLLDTV
jgi:hypothetical protein